MKAVLVFLGLAACACCIPLVSQSIIDAVNKNPRSLWKAGVNSRFANWTKEEFQATLGTNLLGPRPKTVMTAVANDIPDNFDSRTQWPGCVGAIRDQGKCGSCWAFGATESLSDRFCIQSPSKTPIILSPQDITSCDTGNMGCNGGWLENAWSYLVRHGIVTEKCWPYEIPPCHHPCGTPLPTPACKSQCSDPSIPFTSDKHYAKNYYSVVPSAAAIQTEIMKNGPVEAAFHVYADFPNYKSGVYHHVSGGLLGGHAIEIIGWGVEDGTPYWNVKNSWNTEWGDAGLFKILRGKDECGIEDDVVTGMVAL